MKRIKVRVQQKKHPQDRDREPPEKEFFVAYI